MADKLARDLSGPPHSLRVAQLSLDDLYLPHSSLVSLATSHPSNKLLSGRGQPGTHDIELGKRVLSALRSAQEGDTVQLPIYDKSAFDGEGDRSKDTIEVRGPLDVVIFEGWMTGFLPLTSSLSQRYDSLPSTAYAKSHPLESLREVDGMLEEYEELWAYIDAMIQLRPLEPTYTWTWRLQQEHAMKAKNGGVGMTDEQVHAFVDRCARVQCSTRWPFDAQAQLCPRVRALGFRWPGSPLRMARSCPPAQARPAARSHRGLRVKHASYCIAKRGGARYKRRGERQIQTC